jgi:glycosyltransferase involved in cell wall biosynthesis
VLERLALFRDLRKADGVILQRKLLPSVQLALLRHYAQRLIFDFDDAVWLRDSYSAKGSVSRRRSRRFARTVRAADAIVAGNAFLAERAAQLSSPRKVHLIPTCVDLDRYPVAEHRRVANLRLVWIGSSSTLQGLERIRTLLDAIGQAVPGTRLKLICDRFIGFAHMPVEPIPWCEATETKDIATADIGISWVPDDDWSRGKCGLKILQYQAAGLPVIANPVGVHPELIHDGVTGYCANSPEQWIAAVQAMIDPVVRMTLGHAARQQVVSRFSVMRGGEQWADLLHKMSASLSQAS